MATFGLQRSLFLLWAPLTVGWIWTSAIHGTQASFEAGPHPHGPWVLEDATRPMTPLADASDLKDSRYAAYSSHLVDAGPLFEAPDAPRRGFTVHLAPGITRGEVETRSDSLASQHFAAAEQQRANATLTLLQHLLIALVPPLAMFGLGYMAIRRRVAIGAVPAR